MPKRTAADDRIEQRLHGTRIDHASGYHDSEVILDYMLKISANQLRTLKRSTEDPIVQECPSSKWIEIVLVNEAGQPQSCQKYQVLNLTGDIIRSGILDENGFAREDGLTDGEGVVTLPELDEDAWFKEK